MTTIPPRKGVIYGLSCACHPEAGVRYVGQTSQPPAKRLMQHKSSSRYERTRRFPVSRWINSHGADSVVMEVLAQGNTLAELDALEIEYIRKFGTYGGRGLNATIGGGGTPGAPNVLGGSGPCASLSDDQALAVYNLVLEGKVTQKSIAESLGVSKQTVTNIIQGKKYKNLGLDPLGDQRSHMPHMLGESNRNSKLTNAQVLEIHKRHSLGECSDDLALEYGVSASNVNRIAKGVSHPHLNLTNISRGRRPPRKTGESNVGAKLNEGQVREIHRRASEGEALKSLELEFGMGRAAIAGIASARTWKHLGLPPIKTTRRSKS